MLKKNEARQTKKDAISLATAEYNTTRDKVATRLSRVKAVCITADGWTSGTNDR